MVASRGMMKAKNGGSVMSVPTSISEQIEPEVLTRLAEQAKREGKTINDLLNQMLDEIETATGREDRLFYERVTPEEWSRELRAWAASHSASDVIADDSRESI